MKADPALLAAALVGYQDQLAQIDQAMAEIRRRLENPGDNAKESEKPAKRTMSASARKRIAAAQKKRWAEYKKLKG